MIALPFIIAGVLQLASLTVDVREAAPARVPPGAQRVAMLSIRMTASCGAPVTVQGITVRHRGLGAQTDISGVYLLSGTRRLSDARPIASRDGRVPLRLRQFTIPACESADLTVAADFSPDAEPAGEHRFELRSSADIDAPGAAVKLSTSAASRMTTPVGPAAGSVDVTMLPLHERVRYGKGRTLARLRLSAEGDDDQFLTAITFTNEGSARDGDLANLVLMTGGGKVLTAIAPSLSGDSLRLVFQPPFSLARNDTRIFELRGDALASRKRTIRFTVREPSDVEVGQGHR